MKACEYLKENFKPIGNAYIKKNPDIEIISLTTVDGFSVCHILNGAASIEEDKLAATTSTLYAVANAVSNQILGKGFNINFIETEAGNFALVGLKLSTTEFVLTLSTGKQMNIASVRLIIKRLSQEITDAYSNSL